jgi:hypothetical protein
MRRFKCFITKLRIDFGKYQLCTGLRSFFFFFFEKALVKCEKVFVLLDIYFYGANISTTLFMVVIMLVMMEWIRILTIKHFTYILNKRTLQHRRFYPVPYIKTTSNCAYIY